MNKLLDALRVLLSSRKREAPKVTPKGIHYYERSQGGYKYIHVVSWK